MVDFANIFASDAIVLEEPTKAGSFLYPLPPEIILTLLIGPFAVNESVVYFRVEHSEEPYDNCSGTSLRAMLKVVTPIPEIT